VLPALPAATLLLAGTPEAAAQQGPLQSAQWPQFGYDPGNTGRSPYKGPQACMLKWSFELPGWGTTVVVGPDGTVYFGAANTLFAVGTDGREKWRFRIPAGEPPAGLVERERDEWLRRGADATVTAVAAGSDGTIFVGYSAGRRRAEPTRFYALTASGRVKWSFQLGREQIVPQIKLARDGSIYFGTVQGPMRRARCKLYALDPHGRKLWSVTVSRSGSLCSPGIGPDGTIYLGGDKLRAIDPRDGSIKWRLAITTPAHAAPAVAPDGTIYIAGPGWDQHKPEAHRLYALRPDGTLKWSVRLGWCESTPAIAADGTVYVTAWNIGGSPAAPPTGLHALSSAGHIVWTYRTFFPAWHFDRRQRGLAWGSDCSPIVGADGTIYFGADTGIVYAVGQDGKLKWQFEVGGEFDMRPAIDAAGTLYICHAGGPGCFEDFSMRCFALSDSGTVRPHRPSIARRIESLERQLEQARRTGNAAEVEEVRRAIQRLKAQPPGRKPAGGEGTKRFDRGRNRERIRELQQALRKARRNGNEREVHEIVELIRQLTSECKR